MNEDTFDPAQECALADPAAELHERKVQVEFNEQFKLMRRQKRGILAGSVCEGENRLRQRQIPR